jgi:hypothetical protein
MNLTARLLPCTHQRQVGMYREGNRGIMGKVVTSAEMSSDGTVIALGTTTA